MLDGPGGAHPVARAGAHGPPPPRGLLGGEPDLPLERVPWPLVATSSNSKRVLAVGLQSFTRASESGAEWGLICAGP